MNQILFASFSDPLMAEKACGALLDHGLKAEHISLIANDTWARRRLADPVAAAQRGISTTTPEDATAGAATGAGVGLGLGVLAGLAALLIPGVGFVAGGGALATAIASAAGTTVAGALVGGVTGFLKDQGMPAEAAERLHGAVDEGGAIIGISLPPGEMDQAQVRQILTKYNATHWVVHSVC